MERIIANNLNVCKHLKAIFNIMGLEVSMFGIVNIIKAIELYEDIGEEATIRDISRALGESKDIIEMFKEEENEQK